MTEVTTKAPLMNLRPIRESQLIKALDNLAEAFIILSPIRDESGVIEDFISLYANPAAINAIKLNTDGIIGARLPDIFPEVHKTGIFKACCKAADQKKPVILKSVFFKQTVQDKKFHGYFSVSISPCEEDSISVCWHDVTDLMKLSEALKEKEERFHALADNISQFAWMADKEGWIFWYNKRWYDYTGTTLDQMKGWGWQKIHHPDYVDQVMEKFKAALDTGTYWEDTFPLKGKDGAYRWFLSRAMPIRDEKGTITFWFGTNTDITESRLQQMTLEDTLIKLERSNRELEQFAHIAAHDMKEPLRTISSFTKLLERKFRGRLNDNEKQYMKLIAESSRRMIDLISDLLAYAKLGRADKPHEKMDCNLMLLEVLGDLSAVVEESQAVISADPLPELHGDPVQIKQLFQNLIANSLKFCRDIRPEINVSCIKERNEFIFSVKDNGIGIADEFKERIFGLFQRLHTGEEYPGTGIGLSICKKIAEAHNGRIWFESVPGEGTTFYFSLPEKGAAL